MIVRNEVTETVAPVLAHSTTADVDQQTDTTKIQERPTSNSGRAQRLIRHLRTHLIMSLLTAALVASAASAAAVYHFRFQRDMQIDSGAGDIALRAAKDGTVAILSYSPDRLDQDFAAARSHLTGGFLSYYSGFTEQVVAPAAKEKQVTTKASVVREAIVDMQPESSTVLVFINQVTTSKENPDGAFTASSVKVGMTKVGGAWLISSFDPL